MADPVAFITSYSQNMLTLVNTLTVLQRQNQQITDDPSLITNYFTSPAARKDIVAADVTNGQSAVAQLLFTYNSGSPTQAQFILKMTP